MVYGFEIVVVVIFAIVLNRVVLILVSFGNRFCYFTDLFSFYLNTDFNRFEIAVADFGKDSEAFEMGFCIFEIGLADIGKRFNGFETGLVDIEKSL